MLWNLKKSFPDLDAVNVGFGGSIIRDSTHFAPRIIIPYKPGTIVFYAGDNDLNGIRKPAEVAEDFKAFVGVIHKHLPTCRILFLSVKPSILRWKRFEDQTQANSLIREYCQSNDRLTYVDIVPLMLDTKGQPIPELYAKDGLHLSPAGYDKWAPVVRKALGK